MIPITFNQDDLNNVKKGNVRGQDLASFLSLSLTNKVGILDIFENPCTVYQVNYTTTGYATLTLHKGYICVYGRFIYVEEGEQVQVALADSGTINGVFGVRINLGETGNNEVTWFTKTGNVQTDNLLNNEITGVYEFVLYNYSASATSLTLGNKTTAKIQNVKDYLNGENFETKGVDNKTKSLATTEFVHNLIEANKIANKVENGSMMLDNGVLVKWGFARTPSGVTQARMLFDTALPFTKVFSIVLTPIDTSNIDRWIQLTGYDNLGFNYAVRSDRTDGFYIAIGV